MEQLNKYFLNNNRRHFLKNLGFGIGGLALGNLLDPFSISSSDSVSPQLQAGPLPLPHFAPKAKRVIYLFQAGGPSQFELFDYKPELTKRWGQEMPDSVRGKQRLTGMLAAQSSYPLVGSQFPFKRHSRTGGYFSSLVPHIASIADDICMVNSMFTEAINHEPAALRSMTICR